MNHMQFFGVAVALAAAAGSAVAQDLVEVKESDIVCDSFLGFGAQWDSASYDDYNVTDKDFEVIAKRIRWMRTPVVRIMMLSKWCCVGDGIFDFNTRPMQLLYRHLDLCQQENITVLLSDWGCERDWVKVPGVENTADPAYAEVIGEYMNHLINGKGYTCIKYFILVNEPNYEVGDFARWKQGVLNVAEAFRKRALDTQVRIAGSDESNAPDWHRSAVDQLKETLGAYDVHCYAPDAMVRPGNLEAFFKEHWDYALTNDPAAASKPMIVGEAGLNDDAQHPAGNKRIDSFYYGLFMADYAVQVARAGSSAVCAWMMDDNGHKDFFWGLWDNNANGLKLRPWFYPWSLLSRYVPRDSTIFRVAQPSGDVRVLAAGVKVKESEQQCWTFCVVNRGESEAKVALQVPDAGSQMLQQFLYRPEQSATTEDGFPKPTQSADANLGQGVELVCAPGSVLVATTLPW